MTSPLPSWRGAARARLTFLFSLAAATVLTAGCGGDDSTPVATAPASAALTCDDTMKSAFKPDANTTVLLVKSFRKGDPLALSGTPASPAPPVAANDVCLVKLNVGPGNSGPAGAPSTSPGIGIEIWLPSPASWNERIHNLGGGGFAGGTQGSTTVVGNAFGAQVAGVEGSVSGTTDTGHSVGNGSFAMNADGSISTALWQDFSERSLHELALKTKALTSAYYLKQQKFAYWDGCSTGGRQGYKLIQTHPTDYNGYAVGAPAFNWSKFITYELYPQVVMQRDLGGLNPTSAQFSQVGGRAVSACDVVGGQHLGYITNPEQCNYDPTMDAAALCTGTVGSGGVAGTNGTAACVTPVQAQAINKMWFGQTPDGSVPVPTANNGFNPNLTDSQLWFGVGRGSQLAGPLSLAGASPFATGSDMVGLELQNSTIATPAFINVTGNGANGWKNLTYGQMANAFAQGVALQPFFGNINTDDPDLSAAKAAGVKIIHYHGLNDTLIPVGGSINYYTRVANVDGGYAKTQAYDRLYLVPGEGHCFGVGTEQGTAGVSPPATANSVPLPKAGVGGGGFGILTTEPFFTALQAWVENGTTPTQLDITSADNSVSGRLCPYPQKATYNGSGAVTSASNYTCK